MTVKELIKALQNMDPKCIVILQKDGEGNGYSPLSDIDDSYMYLADSTWSGDVALREKHLEQEDIGRGVRCVVLCPVN